MVVSFMSKDEQVYINFLEKLNFSEAFLKEHTSTVTTLLLLHDSISDPDGILRVQV